MRTDGSPCTMPWVPVPREPRAHSVPPFRMRVRLSRDPAQQGLRA